MKPGRSRNLIVVLLLLLFVGLGAGWAWGYGGRLAGPFVPKEKTIEDIVAETVARRQAEGQQVDETDLADAGTIRVLLLGLDARKEDAQPHCDAIHMFAIDTERWTVHVTSVPRGTYAYIPAQTLDWDAYDAAALWRQIEEKRKTEAEAAEAATALETEPAVEEETEPTPEPPKELTDAERNKLLKDAFVANRSYLANVCSFLGLEEGIKRIEGVLGAEADHVVTVGFSQAMGALRLLGLPPVESLQFLRHRQSYGIGDPQRSHNQAVFMKDLIVRHIDAFADPLTVPLARIFYSFVDTDMGFDTAYALTRGLIASGISEHPERITLSMKPSFQVKDYHFDPENPLKQLEPFYEHLAKRLSDKDYSDASVEEIQTALIAFVDARLATEEPVDDLMEKAVWLQVVDDNERERIHFALVERSAHALEDAGNHDVAIDLVTAFIIEKETLGLTDSGDKGRALLATLITDPAQE